MCSSGTHAAPVILTHLGASAGTRSVSQSKFYCLIQFHLPLKTSISPLFTWKLLENYPSQYLSGKEHIPPLCWEHETPLWLKHLHPAKCRFDNSSTVVITLVATKYFPSFPLFFKPLSFGDITQLIYSSHSCPREIQFEAFYFYISKPHPWFLITCFAVG